MDRTQKRELVASLNQKLGNAGLVVVTHYAGMTVAQMTNLRRKMQQEKASFKVTKNRLTRLALAGTKYEDVGPLLKGPTAIAYSTDPVAAAKVVVEFAKTNDKLVILGGSLGGSKLDVAGIKALAELPSLDTIRSGLISLIQTPATRIAGVVQAPAGQLARVFAAYADADQAA